MSLLVVESSDGSQMGAPVSRTASCTDTEPRIRCLGRTVVVKAGGREGRPRLATNVQSALTSAGRGSSRSGAALLTGDELGRTIRPSARTFDPLTSGSRRSRGTSDANLPPGWVGFLVLVWRRTAGRWKPSDGLESGSDALESRRRWSKIHSAANWSTRMRPCPAEMDQSQIQTDGRCWDRRRTMEISKPFRISACSARMLESDFRRGSSSAAIFRFERLWTSVSNGGGDPRIQRLMAILTFERRQSSDSNGGESWIWTTAAILIFELLLMSVSNKHVWRRIDRLRGGADQRI